MMANHTWFFGVVLGAACVAGCGSDQGLPSDLPALPAPPANATQIVPAPPMENGTIEHQDPHKSFADGIIAGEPTPVRVRFDVPAKTKPPQRILAKIVKPKSDGRFIVFMSKLGKPRREPTGRYVAEMAISGVEPGEYTLQAIAEGTVFASVPLTVKPAQNP
jgi:hypothetical protein